MLTPTTENPEPTIAWCWPWYQATFTGDVEPVHLEYVSSESEVSIIDYLNLPGTFSVIVEPEGETYAA